MSGFYSSLQKASGLLVQAQGWRLAHPKLKFGIDNRLPVTSSQSLNLSNLTLWFAFLFKVGVIVLAAAGCLRCVRISGLNLVKTCQAEVGDKCGKNAAVTEIPSRSNLLANTCQAQGCFREGISKFEPFKVEQLL